MKYWFPLFLMAGAAVAGAPGRVEAVRGGIAVPAEAVQVLEPLIVRLLESCSVDSTTFEDQPAAWTSIPRGGSYVRVQWPEPREIRMGDGKSLRVDEILVALPEGASPRHLHVRSGQQLRSFTKYRPEMLLAIGLEPVLGLADEEPYAELARMDWLAAKAQALRNASPRP
jgi:hypothetical protein